MKRGPALGPALTLALVLAISNPVGSRASEPTSSEDVEPGIEAAGTSANARPRVTVTVERTPAGLEIVGSTTLNAGRATAWSVLTDYNGISRFVSSIRESRVTERGTGYVLVHQSAVGRLFLFSRRMTTLLRVREEPLHLIRFEDVLGRDFKSYRGEWQIVERGEQVDVVYRLTAQPSFRIPDVVARGAFGRAVRGLITEVGVEIEGRSHVAGRRPLGDG